MEVRDIVQEAGIKTTPMKKKCKKAKWLSGGGLTNSCEKKRNERTLFCFDHSNKREPALFTVCCVTACHLGLLKVNFKRRPPVGKQVTKSTSHPTPQADTGHRTDHPQPRRHLAANPRVGTATSRMHGPGRQMPSLSKPIWPNPLHSTQTIPLYTSPWLQAQVWCLINICETCLGEGHGTPLQ